MAFFAQAAAAIAHQWPWFWPLVGGVFGAVFGSFLTCARYRIPRGLSLRHPPSTCDSCHRVLQVPDLVPIVSYLILRGRCRFCGASIGWHNTLIEVACTALGAAMVWIFLHR